MNLFRVEQQIDYATATQSVDDPHSVANGSPRGATAVKMFRVYSAPGARSGVDSQNFLCFAGNFLLTIDMIVDMGGRPLKLPGGMDGEVRSQRERMIEDLDRVLKETGQD